MGPGHRQSQSQEAELRRLREEVRRKDLALQAAERETQDVRQQYSKLQSSLSQHSPPSSSPSPLTSNPEAPSPIGNEFQLSSRPQATIFYDQRDTLSRRQSIPRSARHEHGFLLGSHHSLPGTPQSAANHVKRQRTMSQQVPSSHQMNRDHSNMSTQSSSSPFVCNGPVTPLSKSSSLGPHARNSGRWDQTHNDEPTTRYPTAQSMRRSQSTRTRHRPDVANMPPVTESKLLDPQTFFANLEPDAFHDVSIPDDTSPTIPTDQLFLNPDVPPLWNMSNVSVCGSMTTGLTPGTAPMTRENSGMFDNQSVGGSMHMVQLDSHQGTDFSQLDSAMNAHYSSDNISPLGKRGPPSEDDLKGVGTSLSQAYLEMYSQSAPTTDMPMSQDMDRSASSASMASTKSTSSLKSRLKESLARQTQCNSVLKPKPTVDSKSAEPLTHSKKDGKTAICKAKYVRPRLPKVHCTQCNEHPDGFRGEHELRRHRDAKHPEQGRVRKFICVDPASRNLPASVAVVNPLDKCKACKAKKRYGAYYNAAAHLRRTHFKEKPSRAKKHSSGAVPRSDDDKRGGKGGGDWPPMPELKNWMMEIWVDEDEFKADEDEDIDDEGIADTAVPTDMDIDLEHEIVQQPQDHVWSAYNDLENAAANIGFNMFQGQMAINTKMQYLMEHPLISSANFSYSPIGSGFPHSVASQAPQYGSVVSSNDTITPDMTFNGGIGQIGDLQFDEMYPQ